MNEPNEITPENPSDTPSEAAASSVLPNDFKAGTVSILGEPNAGKSTLLNSLLGEKLSIVTAKPQTTRKKILGIYSDEQCQIVFLDTPGVMSPKYKLHKAMLHEVDDARTAADALVLIIDGKLYSDKQKKLESDFAFTKVHNSPKPVLLAINKMDLLEKGDILALIARLSQEFAFKEIVPMSAAKNFGEKELIKALQAYLPASQPLYPTDILSTATERFFVSEIVREKIFEQYSEEIPYSTEVEVEEFREQVETGGGKKEFIRCAIVVERATQRAIVIGKGGAAIKRLGQKARYDIEKFLQRPVFLELFVKVREDWREKEQDLRDFGYR
ncbi:MAG: GTPase Era [Rhizobacter sp.]|nr:GTPase Era [Chlorobiales bacterium]